MLYAPLAWDQWRLLSSAVVILQVTPVSYQLLPGGYDLRKALNTVIYVPMKTSLDLPDDLYRKVKSKSALEGRAVREVATALFTAWVEGRVGAEESDGSAAHSDQADTHQQWLVRWRRLKTDVTQASGGSGGLVEQLHRDRG